MQSNISIMIPCYNEIENIPKMKEELLPIIKEFSSNFSVQVVLVDDGSNDGTYEAFNNTFVNGSIAGVRFVSLRHDVNKGLGAAIRTGLDACTGDIIVTADSDGTYRFSNIPAMVKHLENADIVTASPYHPSGGVVGVPAFRLLLSRASSLMYRLLVGWNIYTYTCLFRAYRREVIENIRFESNDFLAVTEFLVKSKLKGYRVIEFPAVLHRRMFGVSKVKLLRTILDHLKFQWRVLLYRLGNKSAMFG